MLKPQNEMKLILKSHSVNEGFARVAVSAFAAQIDMTLEELSDIKTAVSEAVTNSIVHGYGRKIGNIYITCGIYDNNLIRIKIRDNGCGIEDIKKAMEPMYSSLGGDRAGLGFSVMECFTDKLKVYSKPGKGTSVILEKRVSIKC
ncbi:MAG: Anti-sigma F factor [Firmicutes bacterium ADurb.Bin300]|nr:MAG: Anti-sigma F factor [Firmicutes bacterium ADurb.Bin300]